MASSESLSSRALVIARASASGESNASIEVSDRHSVAGRTSSRHSTTMPESPNEHLNSWKPAPC